MDLVMQYPFMNAAKELVASLDVEPLVAFRDRETRERIEAMIDLCLVGRKGTIDPLEAGPMLAITHVLLRLLLAFINNPALAYKIGVNLSKEYEKLLSREPLAAVQAIANDQGLHVQTIEDERYAYQVPFIEYLSLSTRFKSTSWRLVHKPVKAGFVLLTRHDLCRMLIEAVNLQVISSLEMARRSETRELRKLFMEEFGGYFDAITAKVAAKVTNSASSIDDANIALDLACFPPCALHVLARVKEGINLAHYERLFIVAFCTFAGMAVDQVTCLFSDQPDFNAELTNRQITSIVGDEARSRKRYKPANCAKLLSVGMCFKDEASTCSNGKHPMTNPMVAYKRNLFFKLKEVKQETKP